MLGICLLKKVERVRSLLLNDSHTVQLVLSSVMIAEKHRYLDPFRNTFIGKPRAMYSSILMYREGDCSTLRVEKEPSVTPHYYKRKTSTVG